VRIVRFIRTVCRGVPPPGYIISGQSGHALSIRVRELRFSDYIGNYAMSDDCTCTVPDRTQHPLVRKADFVRVTRRAVSGTIRIFIILLETGRVGI
jgi:hypothetical protein